MSSSRPSLRGDFIACIVLVALTGLVYAQVAQFQFLPLWDDGVYVTGNALVQQGLSFSSVAAALLSYDAGNWHPVTLWSLMLDYELFGLSASAFHLSNLVLHLLNGLLLYAFFVAATGQRQAALLVAALFALHPLHIESVAWVSERKDLLCALFWFAAQLLYLRYARQPGLARYLWVALFVGLALMSKSMAVTLPFALLLLDIWPLDRRPPSWLEQRFGRLGGLLVEKLPLLLMALLVGLVTLHAQAQSGFLSSVDELNLGQRLANATHAYGIYLLKSLAPGQLAFFYPPQQVPSLASWLGMAGLLGLPLLGWLLRQRAPYLLIGILWFFGTLLPVIGLIQVGSQQVADRYTYIPLVGLILAFAYSLFATGATGSSAARRGLATGVALGCVALASLWSYQQLGQWQDQERLFGRALEVAGPNARAHDLLADHFLGQNQLQRALHHMDRAVALLPQRPRGYLKRGLIQIRLGRREAARDDFSRALQLDSQLLMARFNLGLMALEDNQPRQARQHFSRVLDQMPDYRPALQGLADTFFREGAFADSARLYRQALGAGGDDPGLRYNLALSLERQQQWRPALEHYRQAARLAPGWDAPRAKIELMERRLAGPGPAGVTRSGSP